MNRIQNITITFPKKNIQQHQDNQSIFSLLSELQNFRLNKNGLENIFDYDLLPKTVINASSELSYPQVSLSTLDKEKLVLSTNNLRFGFNLSPLSSSTHSSTQSTDISFVAIKELIKKLSGHLIEMNHTGINFSPKFLSEDEYKQFKSLVAESSNLYRYPTGEEWPFIIPATPDEFTTDIKNEAINRNPKFEIVYSAYNENPVIQFDFQTDFTQEEVYRLFPDPYGVSYAGLEDFFRTVFVKVDWGNVLLRFDLRFRQSDNDFGYWLIKDGGRVKS